jgi:hypothetical protein
VVERDVGGGMNDGVDNVGCVVTAKVNSRFLTGPLARFGMTKFDFRRALRGAEAPLFHGAAYICNGERSVRPHS